MVGDIARSLAVEVETTLTCFWIKEVTIVLPELRAGSKEFPRNYARYVSLSCVLTSSITMDLVNSLQKQL